MGWLSDEPKFIEPVDAAAESTDVGADVEA
jgi:hypothetical protein